GTISRFNCMVCGRSAYPPTLSVIADVPARRPSATRRHMQCSKLRGQNCVLLDHLVGPYKDGRRNGKAQRLRRLGVQCQLESCGLLYRQVGGRGALENLDSESSTLSPHRRKIGSIGYETSGLDVFSPLVDCWQPMFG